MPTLLILMPTGGHVDTPAVHSLIGLTQALPRRGIGFALKTYEWSDLVVSRNYLMSYFLAQKKFTHALLLDGAGGSRAGEASGKLDGGQPPTDFRLPADFLPLRSSVCSSKETFCPSRNSFMPARSTALM